MVLAAICSGATGSMAITLEAEIGNLGIAMGRQEAEMGNFDIEMSQLEA